LNRVIDRLSAFFSADRAVPLIQAAVCLVAYAPGIRSMGFYWDDWPMNWIAQNLGPAGFVRYFATNRPVYGLLYLVTTPLIGSNPLAWQITAIVVRWAMALAAWGLVRVAWPERRSLALTASLLFAVYPGFLQQHVALIYTHHFLVIIFLLTSLLCTIAAVRSPHRFWPLTILALALSLANLLMMEYFFMLDLLRPLLVFIVLGEAVGWRQRLWKTLKVWAPYLIVFIGAGIWRAFFFPYTQENYKLSFLDQLKSGPLQAIAGLIGKALGQIWTAFGAAWLQVFHRPDTAETQAAGGVLRFVVLLALLLAFLLGVLLLQKGSGVASRRWGWQALLVGGAALLLAGWPFWLTNVPFSLDFAYDRFTLPFMLGVSLALAGIFDLLPLWRPAKGLLLALLVALAAGWQVETASAYVRDWQVQNGFFQQLTWRVPGLAAGTTVLANELPVHPTDNSLTAPLNWIYAPGDSGSSLPYLLNWPTIRLGTEALPALSKGQPIRKDYLVSVFTGSTDHAISVYYNPPACLRLLNAADANDPTLPDLSKGMAALSNPALVSATGSAQPLPGILSPAQPGAWCEFYEKADLARQGGDWTQIGQIAAEAGDLVMQARSSTELFPFIEGFGHQGQWSEVDALSQAAAPAANSDLKIPVCAILGRLQESTPTTPAKTTALTNLNQLLNCGLQAIQ